MSTTTTLEKLLVFKPATEKEWATYNSKTLGTVASWGLLWILQIASLNNDDIRNTGTEGYNSWIDDARIERLAAGAAEPAAATYELEDDDDDVYFEILTNRRERRDYAKAQTRVYNLLNSGCADELPHITQKVSPHERECGTLLWNALLERFASTKRIAKARIVMDLVRTAQSVGNDKWGPHSATLKQLINSYNATGSPLTIEEVVFALVTAGFIQSKRYTTLGTALLDDEDCSFDTLDRRATELDRNLESASEWEITANAANATDATEAEALQRAAAGITRTATRAYEPPNDSEKSELLRMADAISALATRVDKLHG
mmetsp:Transcript_8399/g.16740  ORF Transcript_8399/g.16740 Transcript_8399/m.16740 type:complete len:318 (-) Transcript_8399:309-1262(-)